MNIGNFYFLLVLLGIPQSSILGPLLFLVYFKDLPEQVFASIIALLYANDTKIDVLR